MPDDRYDPSDWEGHEPKYEVQDGRLYCDGTPVYEWQLTDDELWRYFPERYFQLGKAPVCPMCNRRMNDTGKNGLLQHLMRNDPNHQDALAKTREKIDQVDNWFGMSQIIKEYIKCQNQTQGSTPATQSS